MKKGEGNRSEMNQIFFLTDFTFLKKKGCSVTRLEMK